MTRVWQQIDVPIPHLMHLALRAIGERIIRCQTGAYPVNGHDPGVLPAHSSIYGVRHTPCEEVVDEESDTISVSTRYEIGQPDGSARSYTITITVQGGDHGDIGAPQHLETEPGSSAGEPTDGGDRPRPAGTSGTGEPSGGADPDGADHLGV